MASTIIAVDMAKNWGLMAVERTSERTNRNIAPPITLPGVAGTLYHGLRTFLGFCLSISASK